MNRPEYTYPHEPRQNHGYGDRNRSRHGQDFRFGDDFDQGLDGSSENGFGDSFGDGFGDGFGDSFADNFGDFLGDDLSNAHDDRDHSYRYRDTGSQRRGNRDIGRDRQGHRYSNNNYGNTDTNNNYGNTNSRNRHSRDSYGGDGYGSRHSRDGLERSNTGRYTDRSPATPPRDVHRGDRRDLLAGNRANSYYYGQSRSNRSTSSTDSSSTCSTYSNPAYSSSNRRNQGSRTTPLGRSMSFRRPRESIGDDATIDVDGQQFDLSNLCETLPGDEDTMPEGTGALYPSYKGATPKPVSSSRMEKPRPAYKATTPGAVHSRDRLEKPGQERSTVPGAVPSYSAPTQRPRQQRPREASQRNDGARTTTIEEVKKLNESENVQYKRIPKSNWRKSQTQNTGKTTPKSQTREAPVPTTVGVHREKQQPREELLQEESQPPPQEGSDNRLHIEVFPGVEMPLRGSQETKTAIRLGRTTKAICMGCTVELGVIWDAQFVLCSLCHTVSPLDTGAVPVPKNAFGVGLGYMEE